MGNCLKRESSMHWGGEDWGFMAPETHISGDASRAKSSKTEKKGVLGHAKTAGVTEVKIKISKRQLEELVGKVDVQELSAQQLLAHLINVSDRFETHQRSWRPALQSISELD